MIILSIDPGYERVGISVLEKNNGGKENLLYSECFKTSPKKSHAKRLDLIGKEIEKIIKKYSPKILAIEKLFFNENLKTAMFVAEARGVMLYIASSHNLEIYEYTPLQIKIAVTGYGRGTKKQIIEMVKKLIGVGKKVSQDDEFDAIAVGLTHFASHKMLELGKLP